MAPTSAPFTPRCSPNECERWSSTPRTIRATTANTTSGSRRSSAFEDAFDNWVAWCETSTECAFKAADVGARWDALIAALDANPVKSDSGRPVNQMVMEIATSSALYAEFLWPELGRALADAEAGDGTALLQMADDYLGRSTDGTFDSLYQSIYVIRCASGIAPKPPVDPAALLAELKQAAPRFSRVLRPVRLPRLVR